MNLNLTTTIKCNPDLKDTWQMVYASQLYGTFFAVYAKIVANKDEKCMNSIDLKLINYKGPINLGIHEATYNVKRKKISIIDHMNGNSLTINVLSVTLWIRALTEQDGCEKPITIEQSINEDETYLEINRKLLPLSENGNCVVDGVFDSEFYYRDGLSKPIPKKLDEISGLSSWKKYNSLDKEDEGNVELLGPGGICPRGYAKIIF